ncbi:FecR family protein [Chitinophaga sp. CC14]|uniref:FecR family protein n=1 Tax=Chitinophaga sp. CC14 TaxID=3029199 RepID=UPI003B7C9840
MERLTIEQINELAEKWLNKTITAEEEAQLYQWYDTDGEQPLSWTGEDESEEMLRSRLYKAIKERTTRSRTLRIWVSSAAAAILVMAISSIYFLNNRQASTTGQAKYEKRQSTAPTLTLSNGKRIILSDSGSETFTEASGITITKSSGGGLIYHISETNEQADKIGYNTIETPKGCQYQIVLPDQTKVWLNASSSLTYPIKFERDKRAVKLIGEGYFEVAHNKKAPFKVTSSSHVVEVLGTHFNINAYADEPNAKVTLLEGSVLVENHNKLKHFLSPGQQAVITEKSMNVNNVDTELAVAWKGGNFFFDDTPIFEIMRQISRWYNVEEVVYKGDLSALRLGGSISRTKSLEEVLKLLEVTELVHFTINGKRIIVTK